MLCSLHENFCPNCGALATQDMDALSCCAACFIHMSDVFMNEEIKHAHLEGVFEEDELTFLLRVGEVFCV